MKVKLNGNDWFRITSDFAQIDSAHPRPHTGIDLAMPEGTELFSPVQGMVEEVVNYGDVNIGKGILIKTTEGETMILGHLSEINVRPNQIINVGDFLGLSGSTGNSTGAHLHLGLKGMDGSFINPNKFLFELKPMSLVESIPESQKGVITMILEKSQTDVKIDPSGDVVNMESDLATITNFFRDWRSDGLSYAIYGDSFFNVTKNFIATFFKDLGVFLLKNADLFFLAPALLIMLGTFFIGKNKLTKYIIPFVLAYFVSTFFHKMLTT